MKKTANNLNLLYMVFAIGLVTANAIGAKIFTTDRKSTRLNSRHQL